MRSSNVFALLLSLAMLWGCASSPVAAVPPRVDLLGYTKVGLVAFESNSDAAINAQTTREFESHVQAAQPGMRIVDLGPREALLAAVGSRQFDTQTLRKIGAKYGVDAIFVGNLNYSEPRTEAKDTEVASSKPAERTELRGDIAFELMETRTGDSLWSSSAWMSRPLGPAMSPAERGTSGARRGAPNPREEMVASLVYRLTEDFRPSAVR